jgi:hypothetical protein
LAIPVIFSLFWPDILQRRRNIQHNFFSPNIVYKMAKIHHQKSHQLNLSKTGRPRKMYQMLKEENDQNTLKNILQNVELEELVTKGSCGRHQTLSPCLA